MWLEGNVQAVMGSWGVLQGRWWQVDGSMLSYPMILLGGALLILAGFLLALRRKTRLSVDSSPLTQELTAYLARIADALERLEPPNAEEITGNVLRKLEEIANAKPNGKVREISNSMFGREYRKEE